MFSYYIIKKKKKTDFLTLVSQQKQNKRCKKKLKFNKLPSTIYSPEGLSVLKLFMNFTFLIQKRGGKIFNFYVTLISSFYPSKKKLANIHFIVKTGLFLIIYST